MTGETENLVLELLRGMRAEIADLRRDIGAISQRIDKIDERLEAIDLQLEGWRYVFVATTGSLATDLKAHDARITALEGARP